jgi:hypothetical protein
LSPEDCRSALSVKDLERLVAFKRRYTLEALGFDPVQVERLTFLAWLAQTGRLVS